MIGTLSERIRAYLKSISESLRINPKDVLNFVRYKSVGNQSDLIRDFNPRL